MFLKLYDSEFVNWVDVLNLIITKEHERLFFISILLAFECSSLSLLIRVWIEKSEVFEYEKYCKYRDSWGEGPIIDKELKICPNCGNKI